jgi:phage tail protein X
MDDYMLYTTVEGDTFDSIAFEFYTEEKLASVIIQANPEYCDVLIFKAGINLNIPVISEDAETPGTAPPWRR